MGSVPVSEIQAIGGLDKWMSKAKGRKPSSPLGYDIERMNGLEARYAGLLEGKKLSGSIISWHFENMKLRLADNTFYTPDFMVMVYDGSISFHETKGFWRDDARVKIKMAAEQFPMFSFIAVQWDRKKKEWSFEYFRKVTL